MLAGSVAAARYLGDLYENDAYGLPRDDVEAYAWYRVARSMGKIASGMMGKGLGISLGWQAKDYGLAEMYFKFLLAELNEEPGPPGTVLSISRNRHGLVTRTAIRVIAHFQTGTISGDTGIPT